MLGAVRGNWTNMTSQSQFLLAGLAVTIAAAFLWAQRSAGSALSGETSAPKSIGLEEFDRLRADTNYTVLDVRTPREFAAGHVPNAVNLDWNSDDFEAKVLALDKQKPYLVHCASGVRSGRAVAKMRRLGFTQLYNYSGGWNTWQKAGKPVAR
jgi:rhodanese-related sulfurtransferase